MTALRADMLLKVTTKVLDEVAILEISGRIILGEESELFRQTLKDLLGKKYNKFILVMKDTSYVDSMGVCSLANAAVWARNSGGESVVVSPSVKVSDLLQITKIAMLLPIFDTIEAALLHFGVKRDCEPTP